MTTLKESGLSAALVIGPFGLVAALLSATPDPMVGQLEYRSQEVQSVDLGGSAGRRLEFAQGHGSYKGSRGDPLDGASVAIVESADTAGGMGSLRGYLVFEKDGSTAIVRWSATVTAETAPAVGDSRSFAGSWTLYAGTGRLSAAHGHGLLKGRREAGQTAVTLTGTLAAEARDEPSLAKSGGATAPKPGPGGA